VSFISPMFDPFIIILFFIAKSDNIYSAKVKL